MNFETPKTYSEETKMRSLEEFLDWIDMGLLEDLLKKYFEKSQKAAPFVELKNFLLTRVKLVSKKDLDGANAMYQVKKGEIFSRLKGQISLNEEDVINFKKLNIKNKTRLFFALIHELCHMLSVHAITSTGNSIIGFEEEPLREAVTDLLAEQIFMSLCASKGRTNMIQQYRNDIFLGEKSIKLTAYGMYKNILFGILKALARLDENMSYDKDLLLNGFVRAYLKDPREFNDQLKKLLREHFGENFYSEFKQLEDKSTLFDSLKFIEKYKIDNVSILDKIRVKLMDLIGYFR